MRYVVIVTDPIGEKGVEYFATEKEAWDFVEDCECKWGRHDNSEYEIAKIL